MLKDHFSGMDYEILSGNGYTNLTRKDLFNKISEVTKYMDEKNTFDRLVVTVLTHGNKVFCSVTWGALGYFR